MLGLIITAFFTLRAGREAWQDYYAAAKPTGTSWKQAVAQFLSPLLVVVMTGITLGAVTLAGVLWAEAVVRLVAYL